MDILYSQGDVVWTDFSPSIGTEYQKRRPAVVVSNNDFNRKTGVFLVAPITSTHKMYATRVNANSIPLRKGGENITGQIACEQIRCMDLLSRNAEVIASMDRRSLHECIKIIHGMFMPYGERDEFSSFQQGNIVDVNFSPSIGTEVNSMQYAVIVSNNDYTTHTGSYLVCPLTNISRGYNNRVSFEIYTQKYEILRGEVRCEQLRFLDLDARNAVRTASMDRKTMREIEMVLHGMF